ncbi:2-oxoglutarate dehydrogenase E1 component [Bacteroidetes bacterium endosymbiont of Geopemphigus sp.]|uniref:2-oxoglutarate dehydrogenase E1 component n=1 Tax=Bacteroidetes bacterium endosymbiont of Geopemphigus sp. TaxID=2047937 RepID=UPI000CD26AA0|nr:2-oxoglutarate dehydrogenase E1 component [Bacteroidetes bacterium endosymbiont of Geopemphigus sp.]
MDRYSSLNAAHPELIEELYKKYLRAPDSIEISWRAFFQGFDFAAATYKEAPEVSAQNVKKNTSVTENIFSENSRKTLKEFQVTALIQAYRSRGHLFTKTNPVRNRREYTPNLDIEHFGLDSSDLDTIFEAGKLIGKRSSTLSEILIHLKAVYCESIGIEYMYLRKPEKVVWIQKWLSQNDNHPVLSHDEKKHLLNQLNEAVVFENFLHTKFVGQKRFSIEGNESLLPALDELIEYASNHHQAQEFVIGMPHRGRLNVLTNLFKKGSAEIFSEFDGKEYEEVVFAGDVKYHLGATTTRKNRRGKSVRMSLAPNPSHLETVNPVVQGIARANIDHHYQENYAKLLPILVHGDAAISAQGIIYEIVQMAQLDGYKTGGTIHIVVNNQIGFTTNYRDGRSSTYCTDIGKVTLSPVLHVNADDVEAVIHVVRFAVDFRMHFQQDVFIDLLGYRKYGHNEGDEPRFTQPSLYNAIAQHPNARDIYKAKLQKESVIDEKYLLTIERDFKNQLERDYEISKNIERSKLDPFLPDEWKDFKQVQVDEFFKTLDTCFPLEKIKEIGMKISTLPKEKKFYRKVEKLFEQRRKMLKKGSSLDWGMTELLAYGTLLSEGFDVRLSGEDVERGTFSHRHAAITSEDTEEKYILLNTIGDRQGSMRVYNSLLSEYGVMGFDYGYAMASPNTLTLWEAQFGDFSNGAQIIIDQYLSAAQDKWKTQNGLVLLLPHGYEGQGSEHSSARIERYLQLCGRHNMFVLNCSHPANFYHALRRQMKFSFRKPLIIFTPKSLLRHLHCISNLEELATGSFQPVIDDHAADPKNITRLVICSGKIYYELLERKEKTKSKHIALIRLEQLYPLPQEEMGRILKKYPSSQRWIWVQEEPENMGPWPYIFYKLKCFSLELISRSESASPASGSYQHFMKTQQEILDKVFKS